MKDTAAYRWLKLAVGVSLILLFAFGVVPAFQRLGPVAEVRDAIERSGVDASALFYTENDEFYEATSSLNNAARFPMTQKGSGAFLGE